MDIPLNFSGTETNSSPPPQNSKDTSQSKEHTALTINYRRTLIEQEHFLVNSCTSIFLSICVYLNTVLKTFE